MSGLFGGGKTQSTTPIRYNGIQVNQSVYGNAIPLVYGTTRIPMTLIDYVDFQAKAQTQSGGKGGGSGTTTGYNYSASFAAAICEGPITSILNVFKDSSLTTLAAQNMTLFPGTAAQPPWQYMVTNHPTHALPYDHVCYVAAPNYDLGSSAGLPNLTFEVTGLVPYNVAAGIIDAEPSAIVIDYCTDPNHGVGFPYLAPLTGPNSWQQYCIAMGFFISPQETTQRQAQDFLKEILQITNSQAVWTAGVGLRIVPYQDQPVSGNGASFTPNLTPIYAFQDSDYVYEKGKARIQRSITPANQTFNAWRVEYLDRTNQYNTAIEEFRDELDVAQNGLRANSPLSLHSITLQSVAKLVAALQCLRNLNIRSTFKFKVRGDYSLLEPMDLVAINDSAAGIVNQLVRITETEDDENDVFSITAEEMMVGPASAPEYDTQLAAGYAANYGAAPGSVATPYIFTVPPMLVSANGGYEIGIAVAGSSPLWGGCDVWASLDNVEYDHVGVILGPARVGLTLGALPVGPDPDTTDTVSVQLNTNFSLVINSGSRADADNLRTLCILDGEIISYQNSQALGDSAFALSYLRRGNYGSAITQHNAGAQFAVLDKALFRMPFDPGLSGQPVWFKFVSFNFYGGGVEDISKLPAYQAFFQGQNGGQLLPAGSVPLIARNYCVNVGSRIYKNPTGTTGWDSDCYSKDAFAAACTLRFTASQTNANLIMGVDTNPTVDESYTHISYGWNCNADGNAYIYESGTLIFSTGTYTTATKFEIRYDGKFITYYRDSVQWRSVQAPGLVLYFDSSFYTAGAAVDNVYFGALNPANSSPFVARGNCTVSHENAQKAGGVVAFDSDMYSLEGYPACHFTFKANDLSHRIFIGFTKVPAPSNFLPNSIISGFFLSNGAWSEFLNGNHGGATGTFDTTTVFSLTYDGITITALVNGIVVDTHADATTSNQTYFLYGNFPDPGGGINSLQFGPTATLKLTDSGQLGANAATSIYSSVNTFTGSHAIVEALPISPGGTLALEGFLPLNVPQSACQVIVTIAILSAQGGGNVGDVVLQLQYQDLYSPAPNTFVNGPYQTAVVEFPLPINPINTGGLAGTINVGPQILGRAIFNHVPYSQSGNTAPVSVPPNEVNSGLVVANFLNTTNATAHAGFSDFSLTVEYITK